MRIIKFRQYFPTGFHYWGFLEQGNFVGPATEQGKPMPKNDQFTGLVDKNGVEIYEGDIVEALRIRSPLGRPAKVDKLLLEVIFNEEVAAFQFRCNRMDWNAYYGTENNYEVIGNIYENPELLKL